MQPKQWYFHRLRVRYQETDQMGVVYHANYLNWFEIGRTELIREMGVPYRSIEEKGLLLPVVDAEIKYRLPARYDDELVVCTRIAAFSHVRMEFESQVCRISAEQAASGESDEQRDEPYGQLLVSGRTRHMWLNGQWKPARLDREAPELYDLLKQNVKEA